jgi:UPF0755 protein
MAKDNESTYAVVLGFCVRTLMNLLFLFVLVEGFVYAYHFSYTLFADVPASATSKSMVEITIPEGSSARDAALILRQNGVINNQYLFLARAYLGKYNQKIIAGSYTLGPGMSPDEICQAICGMQSEDGT